MHGEVILLYLKFESHNYVVGSDVWHMSRDFFISLLEEHRHTLHSACLSNLSLQLV